MQKLFLEGTGNDGDKTVMDFDQMRILVLCDCPD